MLEILLCSIFTVLPDYGYRRYIQGKRLGKEITFYSVWFELRFGITACLMLAVLLITIIFYFHPSTTSVTSFFRTIPILPEANGRVSEVLIKNGDIVKQGQPLLRLDSVRQAAAVEVARRRIKEIEAQMVMAEADIANMDGQVQQAQGALQQAVDELRTKEELFRRNADVVARREIEKLQVAVDGRKGQVSSAEAGRQASQTKLSVLLPAERETAEATLRQAQVDLDKTTVYAGVAGQVEQFALQVGDIVNPFMRAAGVLIPQRQGRPSLQAGFAQIEAQVMKVGMAAEVTCASKPLTIIPMVVSDVQEYIASGQFRGGEQLVEVQQAARPGTILVFLEPLFEGGLADVTRGSSCIANAYTSNHDRLSSGKVGTGTWLFLHMVDAVGVVHAMLLRIQALVLPVKALVFSGH
ncbi:MAG: biotin/lipoyl-binding protein [Pseudorhodoplanes sp.]